MIEEKKVGSELKKKKTSPRNWLIILFAIFFFLVLVQFFWETTLKAWQWFKGENTYTYQVEDGRY